MIKEILGDFLAPFIEVEKGGLTYVCPWLDAGEYRCGKCKRGRIIFGDRSCKVCGALTTEWELPF